DLSLMLWDVRTGSPKPVEGLDPDARRKLIARFPLTLNNTPRMVAGTPEWTAAWWDQVKQPVGSLSPRLARLLDRWERAIGLHVDLETGNVGPIPQPGSAYVGKPEESYCQ